MSADRYAALILRAMRRSDRLPATSARGPLGRSARLIAPAMVDRIAARAIRARR